MQIIGGTSLMTKEHMYRIKPGLAWRVIGETAFVFDPARSELHELSESATVIWQSLDKNGSANTAAKRISDEFDVTVERALRDTGTLLTDLQALGLIE